VLTVTFEVRRLFDERKRRRRLAEAWAGRD